MSSSKVASSSSSSSSSSQPSTPPVGTPPPPSVSSLLLPPPPPPPPPSTSLSSHQHHHGGVVSAPPISGLQKDEIIQAIQSANLDQVKRLVTGDLVNLKDRSGNTLLHVATNMERTVIAKWLVAAGADVNAHCNGHTVLSMALNHANYELFEFLLTHKAECIGRNQLNLVHEAVQQQRADIVNTLISRGADPNLYNSAHVTPLSIACAHRNLEICMLLMENGACANLPDKKGNTALHVACTSADASLIECLLANTDCELHCKNALEETPLDQLFLAYMRESRRPCERVVRRLVAAGALFSMPWNFTLSASNAPILILFFAILCKLTRASSSLGALFLPDKPFFVDLITRAYWPNALLVALRTCMADPHFKGSEVNVKDLITSVDLISQSAHFELHGSDLMSTLYACEEAANDSSTPSSDYQLYRHVRRVYGGGLFGGLSLSSRIRPLKLLCRRAIRSSVATLGAGGGHHSQHHDSGGGGAGGGDSPPTFNNNDDDDTDTTLFERLVQHYDHIVNANPHTSRSFLVSYLTLSEFGSFDNTTSISKPSLSSLSSTADNTKS